jgi:hypothetical protein
VLALRHVAMARTMVYMHAMMVTLRMEMDAVQLAHKKLTTTAEEVSWVTKILATM